MIVHQGTSLDMARKRSDTLLSYIRDAPSQQTQTVPCSTNRTIAECVEGRFAGCSFPEPNYLSPASGKVSDWDRQRERTWWMEFQRKLAYEHTHASEIPHLWVRG